MKDILIAFGLLMMIISIAIHFKDGCFKKKIYYQKLMDGFEIGFYGWILEFKKR